MRGEAEVLVSPDEVLVTLGVETWSKDIDSAVGGNDEAMKKVREAIERLGVKSGHVQTDHVGRSQSSKSMSRFR